MRIPPSASHEIQQAFRDVWSTLGPQAETSAFDWKGRRLTNLGDATAASDATTKGQVEAWVAALRAELAGSRERGGALGLEVVRGTLVPDVSNLRDIGQSARRFRDGWFNRIVRADQIGLSDTDDTHHLLLTAGSNLTADRALTFTTGDAARTVTLNGNPTLDDWFNQGVKSVSSPSFVVLSLGTNAAGSGSLRLPRATPLIAARNQANSGNLSVFGVDSSDNFEHFVGGAAIWYSQAYAAELMRLTSSGDLTTQGVLFAEGGLKVGTHSAIGAETVTGYITVTDAGGASRKLAVVS